MVAPLENGQPVLGAVWSVIPGDPKARGFGKSTMMGEEAKIINRDFGFETLTHLGISEDDARKNPVLASYVSFNTKANEGIASIDAASFHLLRFLLRSTDAKGVKIHQRLREHAAALLVKEGKAIAGKESDAIVREVISRFRNLAVSIDIRNLLADYLDHLASGDTDALEDFLSSEVIVSHHNRNGLKYLQVFVVFAELANIQHFTFFIDQVEDFTSEAQPAKIRKNVKIIRDALLESEPFASRASFIFQLHPDAYRRLGDASAHEDLRDLNYDSPLNSPFVVTLKGLEKMESATCWPTAALITRHSPSRPQERHMAVHGRVAAEGVARDQLCPRAFLRALYDLLELAKAEKVVTLDEKYITPKLEGLGTRTREEEGDNELGADDRLS